MDNKQNLAQNDLLQHIGPSIAQLCKANAIDVTELKLQITKNISSNRFHIIIVNSLMQKKEIKKFAEFINVKAGFDVCDINVYNG